MGRRKRKSRHNPDAVGTHPLIQVVRIQLRRDATESREETDEEYEARNDAEIDEVLAICNGSPLCVVQVYDCKGRYLYTPQGEEEDTPILGDPEAAVIAKWGHLRPSR